MPSHPLRLQIITRDGNFLRGLIDIDVRHRTKSEHIVVRGVDASREITIEGVAEGEYEVTISRQPPASTRLHRQVVKVPDPGTVTFLVSGDTAPPPPPPDVPPPEEPLPSRYVVAGQVSSPDRGAVGGLRVAIVDKNVGGDVLVQTAQTNDRGIYSTQFEAAVIRGRGKKKPDLQARVHAGETFLGASAVQYDAREQAILNVTLPAGASSLPVEYEALTLAIRKHFARPLRDLQENAAQQDITFLANKTGWDARAVALASLADRFSSRDDIPAPFYYALFRAGLPADEQVLYKTDTGTVDRILRESVAAGVVPKELESQVSQAVGQYARVSATARLSAAPDVGVSTLKDMLAVARLDTQSQQRFATLIAQHGEDAERFWPAVAATLGNETAQRLQVDGKLGFLTLNNAPLMDAIHRAEGPGGVRDPVQLAEHGYHRAERWQALLGAAVAVPDDIPGANAAEKRTNYAEYLAAQVRISYPTASVAEMLTTALPAASDVREFLNTHRNDFAFGVESVERFVHRNELNVPAGTIEGVKRLHRLHQMTPSDEAMTALARTDIRSALDIVSLPREAFVSRFRADLGESAARMTWDRAATIHNAAFNVAIGFLSAQNGIDLGFGQILRPGPRPPAGANAGDVIAYSTMEALFGSMDFCACDHCRSVLSPAAYLVDLLQFIDRPQTGGAANPQDVLFGRRPDIRHLPLTCENTNTALPYIDVVNETLEYFIANQVQPLSLQDYAGHDTDGSASEDLLATPQFVIDRAYDILRGETFPPPLPFHRPLEALRASFDKFDVPLPVAMERLRKTDDLTAVPYGWRDILLEEIRVSRRELEILTDHAAVTLADLYGFAHGTSDATVIAEMSNAKTFARRTGVTYEELVALLRTRFVNPASDLLPRLENLGVNVPVIVDAVNIGDVASIARFDEALPRGAGTLDPFDYGGDILGWARDAKNFARLMTLIVLTPGDPNGDPCDFELLELRRARPAADPSNRLDATAFTRLIRFIRLWRKTGWTMEQTDAAMCALANEDCRPVSDSDIDTLDKIDERFATLLPRLGVVARVIRSLRLNPARDLQPLLACWSDVNVFGANALYRQLFLNPTVLRQAPLFAADRQGEYLRANEKLSLHAEAVRGALGLTSTEYDDIVTARGLGGATKLSVASVSAIYRAGFLARKLRLSVRELLTLIEVTGIDPFTPPDFTAGVPPQQPAILQFLDFLQAMKARGVKVPAALYLVWNEDLTGKAAPDRATILELARSLRGDYADIETQLSPAEDADGPVVRELARERKRQQALQRVSAAAKTDVTFARTILDPATAPYPLHASGDATRPALQDALALETTGWAAEIFHGPIAAGTPDAVLAPAGAIDYSSAARPLPQNPTAGSPISVSWRGKLETPEAGSYVLVFEIDDEAAVGLHIDGEPRPLVRDGSVWRTADPLAWKGAALYDVEVRIETVTNVVRVQWETPKRPREVIPARYVWPENIATPFVEIHERFLKVARLAEALRLTANEIAHLAADGWLNDLPAGSAHAAGAAALGVELRRLLEFARVKNEVSPADEQVLVALTHAADAAKIMQWDNASVAVLLTHFGLTVGNLGDFASFARVHDAMTVLRTLGVPAGAVTVSLTNDPTPAMVRDLQSALRARYAVEDWRALVQPVNDRLRALQRDALVAFVLHRFRGDPATKHIDTVDKLFEYFLMDVAMEPCMQTSRIRHALSSVQLFIERSLMNLETRVSPAALDAEQWEWMKRYRMWEANRKVFLYPENWLAPELRDDKSPFFKEIESELLQSDITEESAAAAVLNYLAKLEEVASLEPCGVCRVPRDPARDTREVVHVIARTSGANRKYFYRRRDGLTWTPWEAVKVDIEDNPLLPVVWNGRLLLFWLRVMKDGPAASNRPPGGKKLTDLTTDNVPSDPRVTTKAVLCWSEYYGGKWQAMKTSDAGRPMTLAEEDVARRRLRLAATFAGEALRIHVQIGPTGFGFEETYSGTIFDDSVFFRLRDVSVFVLYNTNALPEQETDASPIGVRQKRLAGYLRGLARLTVRHVGQSPSSADDVWRSILKPGGPIRLVETRQPYPERTDPFFVSDSRHVFYTTVEEELQPLFEFPYYAHITVPDLTDLVSAPPLVVKAPQVADPPRPDWLDTSPVRPGAIDTGTIERFVSEDAYIRHALPVSGSIVFDGQSIGPAGAIVKTTRLG
jgi:Neuraminidase-like domain/Salmonella virulence plasmid 28.1kDa A protein